MIDSTVAGLTGPSFGRYALAVDGSRHGVEGRTSSATSTPRLSLVLSGGGCKSFWSIGALEVLREELPEIHHWAGVSAGAAMALAQVTGRFDRCFEHFIEIVGRNRRNVYPARVLRRQRAFPHDDIYRSAVRRALHDGGFANVRKGPPVHILLSYVKAGYPFVATSAAAVREFAEARRRLELHGPARIHPGIGEEVVCSRDAMDPDQLLDWTLMSSTIPPFTPIMRKAGRRYLDGGLIDNVPIRALPADARGPGAKILCLVSHKKPTPRQPVKTDEGAEVLYIAARDELPVRIWDYTSPERIYAARDLGRRDAKAHRARVLEFLDP